MIYRAHTSSPPGLSPNVALCFQRVVADFMVRGDDISAQACLEMLTLLESWNQDQTVCAAAALAFFMIQGGTRPDLRLAEFRQMIGDLACDLAAAVLRCVRRDPPTGDLTLESAATVQDKRVCNILASAAFVIHKGLTGNSYQQIRYLFDSIAPFLCTSAYRFYMNSNVLLGLDPDAHAAALSHAISRLLASKVCLHPCRHMIVTRVFPDRYYDAMIRLRPKWYHLDPIPKADSYEMNCSRTLGVAGQRYHRWLVQPSKEPDGPRHIEADIEAEFWHGVAELLSAPTFMAAVSDRVFDGARCQYASAIRLVQEIGVAYIPPHLDMPHKRATLLFYLPGGDASATQGTSLYTYDVTAENFQLRKTIQFLDNTSLILPRSEDAFHGVEPHVLTWPRTTLHLYLQDNNYLGSRVFQPKT